MRSSRIFQIIAGLSIALTPAIVIAYVGAYGAGGGGGDTTGAASSTDNAVVRWDGTGGKTIQNSVVIIADTTGNTTGMGTLACGAITSTGAITGGASSHITTGSGGDFDLTSAGQGMKVTGQSRAIAITGDDVTFNDQVLVDTIKPKTAGGNIIIRDSADNLGVTFSDTGTEVDVVATGDMAADNYTTTSGAQGAYQSSGGADGMLVNTGEVILRGSLVDGATAYGVKLGSFRDLLTAGATIAEFVDDCGFTGSTCVEKANVNLHGEFLGSLGSGATAVVYAGGTLDVNTTAVGNVGAGEDTLISYTLPANSLIATGRGVHVRAEGTFANNANVKTLKCKTGTQTVLTNAPTVSVAGEDWVVEYTFTRTGASAQDWKAEYRANSGAAGVFLYDAERGTATQTETGTLAVTCTGEGVADNDIVMESQIVKAF